MPLDLPDLAPDPLTQFGRWFNEARIHPSLPLPEAMCLATVAPNGRPEARMVLLKGVESGGFVFYTNLRSPKCESLEANPVAAITFYWEPLRRQIRIEGSVEAVTAEEADTYFASRPRESRLAAWASNQSAPIASRAELEEEFARLEREYSGRDVPRPPFWSGFRVIPDRMEFWAEREHRLHDRFAYSRTSTGWTIARLAP